MFSPSGLCIIFWGCPDPSLPPPGPSAGAPQMLSLGKLLAEQTAAKEKAAEKKKTAAKKAEEKKTAAKEKAAEKKKTAAEKKGGKKRKADPEKEAIEAQTAAAAKQIEYTYAYVVYNILIRYIHSNSDEEMPAAVPKKKIEAFSFVYREYPIGNT